MNKKEQCLFIFFILTSLAIGYVVGIHHVGITGEEVIIRDTWCRGCTYEISTEQLLIYTSIITESNIDIRGAENIRILSSEFNNSPLNITGKSISGVQISNNGFSSDRLPAIRITPDHEKEIDTTIRFPACDNNTIPRELCWNSSGGLKIK